MEQVRSLIKTVFASTAYHGVLNVTTTMIECHVPTSIFFLVFIAKLTITVFWQLSGLKLSKKPVNFLKVWYILNAGPSKASSASVTDRSCHEYILKLR